jgi:hypothetical protein
MTLIKSYKFFIFFNRKNFNFIGILSIFDSKNPAFFTTNVSFFLNKRLIHIVAKNAFIGFNKHDKRGLILKIKKKIIF